MGASQLASSTPTTLHSCVASGFQSPVLQDREVTARTHPTWSPFGEVSDSKSRPGAVDCAVALEVTESILSGFM